MHADVRAALCDAMLPAMDEIAVTSVVMCMLMSALLLPLLFASAKRFNVAYGEDHWDDAEKHVFLTLLGNWLRVGPCSVLLC